MGREGPSKKHGCLWCEKRPKCRKLCARMLRKLPTLKDTPGVSMIRGSTLQEDLVEEEVRKPAQFASYANQKLLELAGSIREKFSAEEWGALNRIWAEGYRRSEAAKLEGVSPSMIRKRMLSVARVLRKEFTRREVT